MYSRETSYPLSFCAKASGFGVSKYGYLIIVKSHWKVFVWITISYIHYIWNLRCKTFMWKGRRDGITRSSRQDGSVDISRLRMIRIWGKWKRNRPNSRNWIVSRMNSCIFVRLCVLWNSNFNKTSLCWRVLPSPFFLLLKI